ncbi:hypothetical protein FGX01_05765, partial [Xylella fastidiosa subsp. multiplex]|nr:hypothetical protein [Xylella fastidiosa subsp. multiplex]
PARRAGNPPRGGSASRDRHLARWRAGARPARGRRRAAARIVGEKLAQDLRQPVVVENRPGGNGFIAIDAFKRGAKDGHDIIVLDNVHLAAYPALFKKLPYD